MSNNKDWERRSNEWVKSMHESRLVKEKHIEDSIKTGKKQKVIEAPPKNKPYCLDITDT